MTYTQHAVTPKLLARLWADLWERGKQEIDRNGLTQQQAFERFIANARHGASGILCADGKPILVAGICRNDGELVTFMACSNDFEQHYRQIVRVIRRFVYAHNERIYIYSVAVHPKTARFFRALGFESDCGWRGHTVTGATLYRFKRKNERQSAM